MAWITPVTDRDQDALCSYEDMNRIAGNINHLYPDAGLKDDYIRNDFVTANEWDAILSALSALTLRVGLRATQPTDAVSFDNFNTVETLTLTIKERIDALLAQAPATIYAGDGWYSATPVENYSRGI